MAEGVDGAAVVLVFMTKKYENSDNCMQELNYTKKQKKTFIPIKLEENYTGEGALGLISAGILYEDFSDESTFKSSFARLKQQIKTAYDDGEIRRPSQETSDGE
eukprot:gene19590-21515_t